MNREVRVRKEFDATWSSVYRQGDQTVIDLGGAYVHYGQAIEALCLSFDRSINALDLGCGTGRYFHRLRGVSHLVGSDLSPDMLEQAKNPIRAEDIEVRSIELVVGDVFSAPLKEGSFDLVYSIGVLGEYTPMTAELVDRIYRLVKPGGVAFFTATDIHSRVAQLESVKPGFVRRAFRKVFPYLPDIAKREMNRFFSPCYITPANMQRLLRQSAFSRFTIAPYVHPSGWRGTNLDCTAWKN